MIPIDELVEVCERHCSSSLGWFETLGRWVVDETDPRSQRWFAAACHRTAWHAELWFERRPAIPHDVDHARPRPADVGPTDDRSAALRDHLVAERRTLAELAARVDHDLDPSTIRVVRLVDADLADLLDRAPDRRA